MHQVTLNLRLVWMAELLPEEDWVGETGTGWKEPTAAYAALGDAPRHDVRALVGLGSDGDTLYALRSRGASDAPAWSARATATTRG